MQIAEQVEQVLGGPTVLRRRVRSVEDMTLIVKKGLPFSSLLALSASTHIDIHKMGQVLMIPARTMARRRKTRRLTAAESDRLMRFARVVSHAIEVFGDADKAAAWLNEPNRLLNHTAPIDVLDTDAGTHSVETILGRIDYGVFS
jgi:putative toxin-antitoxin system antitoxin component (TIGR02293 family)